MKLRYGMALAAAMMTLPALAGDGGLPSQMIGEWRWGTINPTTFYDKSSGAYLGHGGGMSCYFVFGKDGRYKKFFYVQQSPTAGWTTKAWTTSEGTVLVSGDTFTLKAEKGHYKGEDNRVAKYNIDRAMTAADLKNEANTKYRWSMGKDEQGRTVMFIAPGGSGQGSRFDKVK